MAIDLKEAYKIFILCLDNEVESFIKIRKKATGSLKLGMMLKKSFAIEILEAKSLKNRKFTGLKCWSRRRGRKSSLIKILKRYLFQKV